ncbi:hypothetical protein R5H32_05700 [Defluviimonas sp. D31]|uniref:hypothetical protein n=1 Tax=Defluviimonas sp. D31 TaxID=3083253 RepID=UPI00296E84E9|nr:hypothetical protein [Defluviimonas sp. D31]MDW4548843.1 hypothetical protein [Defluviimonas sp. D31]
MKFSLSTYIKLCLLDTGRQISEIQKKLSSTGGFDFYWTLSKAIAAYIDGKSDDEINDILLSSSSPSQQTYNTAAYENFIKRFGKKKNMSILNKKKTNTFFTGGIAIVFDPLFSIEDSSGIHVYSIWANQKPELTQKYGAVACYLQREAYKNSALANSKFYFADLAAGRIYSESQITNSTSIIAKTDLKKINNMVSDLE